MLKRAPLDAVRRMPEAQMREFRGRWRWMQLHQGHSEGQKLPMPLLFGGLRKWAKRRRIQGAAKMLPW